MASTSVEMMVALMVGWLVGKKADLLVFYLAVQLVAL